MTVAYGLLLLALGLSAGAAAARRCNGDLPTQLGAGLLAAAHAPPLLATSAMAAAAAFPGHDAAIRWAPLLVVLSCVLASSFWKPRSPGIRMKETGKGFHVFSLAAELVLAGCVVAILVKFLTILVTNLFPVIANDALTYLAEARMFAAQSNLLTLVPGLGNPATGAPPTHPHTALFSVYLGHALLFSPGAQAGGAPLGDDMPARMAFQFTVLCLAMAVVGMTVLLAAGRRHAVAAGIFALLFFCAFQTFEYMSFNSSRDPFRLIPWLGLLTLLFLFVERRGLTLGLYLAVAATAGWLAAAHTINLYFLAVAAPVLLVATLVRRVPVGHVLMVALAGLAGLALPLLHYIDNLRRIGNVLGNGMNYFHYPGTVLAEAFLRYGNWNDRALSPIGALRKLLEQQGMPIGIGALVGAVTLLILACLGPRERRTVPLILVVIFWFILVIPLVELKRLFPIDMKEAIISNYRYAYTVFILSPVIMALALQGIVIVIERAVGPKSCAVLVAASTLVMTHVASRELRHWRTYPSWDAPVAYRASFKSICAAARALPDTAIWLSDRSTVSYECGIWPTFLYSPAGRRYFLPATVEEARKVLQDDRVGLVSLEEAIPGWWPETPFYKALVQLKDEGTFEQRQEGTWQIFTRRAAKAADGALHAQARASTGS